MLYIIVNNKYHIFIILTKLILSEYTRLIQRLITNLNTLRPKCLKHHKNIKTHIVHRVEEFN